MKNKLAKIFGIILVLVLTVSLFAGCQQDADPDPNGDQVIDVPTEPVSGGHIILAFVDDPPTFDIDRTTWAQMTQSVFYDGLVEKDMDGNITGRLAHDWEISEDGKTWRFFLREDVTFHSGNKFDAHAVKFRLDRMMNPDNPSANAHMIASVESVEVEDDYTVVFHLDPPDAAFWDFLGSAAFGAIFDPAAVEEYGEDFGQNPVGTGPWMMHEYVPGSHLTVVRNEDYAWGAQYWDNQGAPYPEMLTFRFIPDEATRMLELEQGNVDYSPVPPQEYSNLVDNENIQLITFPSNGIRYWGFNNLKWPWTDKATRQAMRYAIDRHAITEFALEGLAQPLWSHLPPSIAGYDEDMEQGFRDEFPYDPEMAMQALEEAGWTMRDDGFYEKDGQKFEVELWVRNDPIEVRVAEMLKENLADVGVDLDIEIMEQARLTTGTPQGLHETILWMYGWYDPDILFHVFNNGGTRVHFKNDELQSLLEAGRQVIEMDDRLPFYDQAQALLTDEAPWIVLYFPENVIGFSQRVHGIRVNPHTGNFILNDLWLWE